MYATIFTALPCHQVSLFWVKGTEAVPSLFTKHTKLLRQKHYFYFAEQRSSWFTDAPISLFVFSCDFGVCRLTLEVLL